MESISGTGWREKVLEITTTADSLLERDLSCHPKLCKPTWDHLEDDTPFVDTWQQLDIKHHI
jgi:hypothetical protein